MLTKILFTLLVIIVVAVVFRHKTQSRVVTRQSPGDSTSDSGIGIQGKTIIYAILGLILVLSGLFFLLHWQDQHQIVNIQVTDSSGVTAAYQAYKKSIQGRSFVTLDGREVTLGSNDRVEMTSTD
jgi:hypothetical protein